MPMDTDMTEATAEATPTEAVAAPAEPVDALSPDDYIEDEEPVAVPTEPEATEEEAAPIEEAPEAEDPVAEEPVPEEPAAEEPAPVEETPEEEAPAPEDPPMTPEEPVDNESDDIDEEFPETDLHDWKDHEKWDGIPDGHVDSTVAPITEATTMDPYANRGKKAWPGMTEPIIPQVDGEPAPIGQPRDWNDVNPIVTTDLELGFEPELDLSFTPELPEERDAFWDKYFGTNQQELLDLGMTPEELATIRGMISMDEAEFWKNKFKDMEDAQKRVELQDILDDYEEPEMADEDEYWRRQFEGMSEEELNELKGLSPLTPEDPEPRIADEDEFWRKKFEGMTEEELQEIKDLCTLRGEEAPIMDDGEPRMSNEDDFWKKKFENMTPEEIEELKKPLQRPIHGDPPRNSHTKDIERKHLPGDLLRKLMEKAKWGAQASPWDDLAHLGHVQDLIRQFRESMNNGGPGDWMHQIHVERETRFKVIVQSIQQRHNRPHEAGRTPMTNEEIWDPVHAYPGHPGRVSPHSHPAHGGRMPPMQPGQEPKTPEEPCEKDENGMPNHDGPWHQANHPDAHNKFPVYHGNGHPRPLNRVPNRVRDARGGRVHHISPHNPNTNWQVPMTGETQTLEIHLGVDYRDLFMGVLMGMLMMGIVTVGVVFGLLKRLRYYEQLEAYDAGEDDEYDRWEAEAEEEGREQEKQSPTPGGDVTPGGDDETKVVRPAQRKSSIQKMKTFVTKVTKLNPSFTTVSTKMFNHRAATANFKPEMEKNDTGLEHGLEVDYSKTETGVSNERPNEPMINRSMTTPAPNVDMTSDMGDWVRERAASRSLTMPKVDRTSSIEILYKSS